MIIGLCGANRSGKDTVTGVLIREHGFTRFAFADALKGAALDIDPLMSGQPRLRLSQLVAHLGWEKAKECDEVRRTLQRIGMAVRQLDPGIWVRIITTQIRQHQADSSGTARIVISDVRFPNEVHAVRELGGHLVRVVRPGPATGTNQNDTHISETALDFCPVDAEIRNDGSLDELAGRTNAVVESAEIREQ